MKNSRAKLLMIFASMIWGSSFVVGRWAIAFVDPIPLAFWENVFGFIILLAALMLKRKGNLIDLLRDIFSRREIIVLGVLNGLAYALQYISLSLTTAINSSLLVNLGISTLVPLFAHIMSTERITKRKILALILGLIGAGLISTGGDLSTLAEGRILGDMLALSVGACWAVWIVVADSALENVEGPLEVAAPNAGFTVLILGLTTALMGGLTNSIILGTETVFSIIYLGVFSIGLAYLFYYEALKDMGGTASALYLLLQAAVTMSLGVLLLNENLTPILVFGAMLIMIAIVFVEDKEQKEFDQ
ncbi:DMT family transporter [Candidatus Thorarchaeota archaeon]|nr:MAG: DMT family transporter [Candidatus Thorarchaeota archaeon]